MNKYKIINYNNFDPRYNLTISDSDEYNVNIYPLLIKKQCNDSDEFKKFLEYDYPSIARCWGERYENCADLSQLNMKYHNNNNNRCICSRCRLSLYKDIGSTITWNDLREFNPKKLNNNNFYDQTRIMNGDLIVDNSTPDTNLGFINNIEGFNNDTNILDNIPSDVIICVFFIIFILGIVIAFDYNNPKN